MENKNGLINQINDLKKDWKANYDALKALSKQLVGTRITYKDKHGDIFRREVLYTMKDTLAIIVLDDDNWQKYSAYIASIEILNIFPMDFSDYESHAEYLKQLEADRREILDWRASQLSPKQRKNQWYKFANFYG